MQAAIKTALICYLLKPDWNVHCTKYAFLNCTYIANKKAHVHNHLEIASTIFVMLLVEAIKLIHHTESCCYKKSLCMICLPRLLNKYKQDLVLCTYINIVSTTVYVSGAVNYQYYVTSVTEWAWVLNEWHQQEKNAVRLENFVPLPRHGPRKATWPGLQSKRNFGGDVFILKPYGYH